MREPVFIVFSGYNPRAVIAFLRSTTRCGAEVAILAADEQDRIFQTDYARFVKGIRSSRALDCAHIFGDLEKIKAAYPAQRYIIAPSTESLNRFLLRNRTGLEDCGFEIPLVDERLYLEISDKSAFADCCRHSGLKVPKEYAGMTTLPCVAKPIRYQNAAGDYLAPVILKNEADRKDFSRRFCARDYFYQEFVAGESHYLLYYFTAGGGVLRFSQRNLLQQAGGKSMVAAVPGTLHKTAIADQYEKLFQGLSFRGFVMVELRETADHRYIMIEANPRFWGPSQLSLDAGCDFFRAFLADYAPDVFSTPPPPPEGEYDFRKTDSPSAGAYFWAGGLPKDTSQGDLAVLSSFAPTREDYARWLPFDVYNRPDTQKLFESGY